MNFCQFLLELACHSPWWRGDKLVLLIFMYSSSQTDNTVEIPHHCLKVYDPLVFCWPTSFSISLALLGGYIVLSCFFFLFGMDAHPRAARDLNINWHNLGRRQFVCPFVSIAPLDDLPSQLPHVSEALSSSHSLTWVCARYFLIKILFFFLIELGLACIPGWSWTYYPCCIA